MTMTRVSFCPKCFQMGRPKTNDQFVVFGTTHQTYIVYEALNHGRRGFTPHNYDLKRVVDGEIVYYHVACSMVGCESSAIKDPKDKDKFRVGFDWDNSSMPLNQWNALVKYKHDQDFEI